MKIPDNHKNLLDSEISLILASQDIKKLNHKDAGPLLCGGITVFTPIVEFGINKIHKVGIIGIGGLVI